MKYNIEGSKNDLRIEICSLQKDVNAIRDCNNQIKSVMSNESAFGFYVALLLLAIWIFGYGCGMISK